ncbi:MAG: universal stress protein [Candidatus Hydrogenedentota bacterium]
MIKHILVPTDGSHAAWLGVRYAIALASQHKAKLHGLHVVDVKLLEGPFLRDISASLGTSPYANYRGNLSMILEERGKAILQSFREACETAGVDCDTIQTAGIVAHTIVEQSELADLIVMGRAGEHDDWLDGLLGSATEAVARKALRPVLITGVNHPGGDRFLVAYDGSSHARAALQTAANMCHEWEARLHVLSVGMDYGERWLQEAQKYLEPHELDVEYTVREGDPREVIVRHARAIEADLLILGAYGHSKVRELLVGSTTAHALNHAPCPLLLVR